MDFLLVFSDTTYPSKLPVPLLPASRLQRLCRGRRRPRAGLGDLIFAVHPFLEKGRVMHPT